MAFPYGHKLPPWPQIKAVYETAVLIEDVD
jgi:hypothetical protein